MDPAEEAARAQATASDTVPAPGIDVDLPCPHEHFTAHVDVNRIGTIENPNPRPLHVNISGAPIEAFSADVRISCTQCGEPFRFIGMPAGVMPNRPACSVDEREAHLPIRPASSDPDFGLGIPGFAVRYFEGTDRG